MAVVKAWHSQGNCYYAGEHIARGDKWTAWEGDDGREEGVVIYTGGIRGSQKSNQLEVRIPRTDLVRYAAMMAEADEQKRREAENMEAVRWRTKQRLFDEMAQMIGQMVTAGFGSPESARLYARVKPHLPPDEPEEEAAA